MDGTLDPIDVSDSAKRYRALCFHAPCDFVLKLYAINDIIGGHGVEHISPGEGSQSPAIDYVNMGDTYTTTILRLAGGRYRVQCWGDIVERGRYA